jgi:osmotically-inducible protein OsmY
MRALYAYSLLAVVTVLLACSGPAHAAKADSRIEAAAKQSYVFKTYLKDDEINVTSKGGIVTMTGLVSENFHKSLAQETVASLPGVKSVDNKLEVKGSPLTINSDEWVLDKVKVTLLFHRSVSAGATEIAVKQGVVTLRGNAASQAQKELTTEYAKDVEGVKDVVNEMVVTTPPKTKRTMGERFDDASITSQVKMTLLYHRSTSAFNTTVETKRGVVSLTGKVSNDAELNLVTKLAGDVHGVKSIRNLMTIQ